MWSVNILSLLLFCYACLSTGNGEVYFVSKNFYNVLKWDPVKPAFPGQKVLYSVQYYRDDEEGYQIKTECQNITILSCDLTAETPSLHDTYYRAKVCVNGTTIGFTTVFKPLRDTHLGPPILSTHTTVSALRVQVTLPRGPKGVSVAEIMTNSKKAIFKTVPKYILHITHPEWVAQVRESTTGQFDISLKYNHTEYCGYVFYKPNSELSHSGSENASFCVTLPEDHRMLSIVAVALTVTLFATIVISVVCMCNYVKGGKTKRMPQILENPPRTCKVLQNPDRNLILSELLVCTQSEKTIYAKIQAKPNVVSHDSGGYSPQDIHFRLWQDNTDSSLGTGTHSTAPGLRDMSAQSSEIYSAVVVHVLPEENEEVQQAATENKESSHSSLFSSGEESWNKDGIIPKLNSRGAPPLCGFDAGGSNLSNQLVLNTVLNINGQLILPSLTFQSQNSDTVSLLKSERKPLSLDLVRCQDNPPFASLPSLDSLECQDSGCEESTTNTPTNPYCNTHYFPSQRTVSDFHQGCQATPSSQAMFESNYKQNWVPEMLHGTASTDTWMSPKMDEEEGEDEGTAGLENSTQILLGHWKLKIQE